MDILGLKIQSHLMCKITMNKNMPKVKLFLLFMYCLIYVNILKYIRLLHYFFRVHFIINPFEIKWYKNYCSGERYVADGPLDFKVTWLFHFKSMAYYKIPENKRYNVAARWKEVLYFNIWSECSLFFLSKSVVIHSPIDTELFLFQITDVHQQ